MGGYTPGRRDSKILSSSLTLSHSLSDSLALPPSTALSLTPSPSISQSVTVRLSHFSLSFSLSLSLSLSPVSGKPTPLRPHGVPYRSSPPLPDRDATRTPHLQPAPALCPTVASQAHTTLQAVGGFAWAWLRIRRADAANGRTSAEGVPHTAHPMRSSLHWRWPTRIAWAGFRVARPLHRVAVVTKLQRSGLMAFLGRPPGPAT